MNDKFEVINGTESIIPDDGTRLRMHNGWPQIDKACNDAVHAIHSMNLSYVPEAIVAITPDVIPATIISNALEIPIFAVTYGSVLESIYTAHSLPRIYKPIVSGMHRAPDAAKLIVVTSVLDNDEHVNDVVTEYKKRGHEVKVVTLFHCNDIPAAPVFYYWQHIKGGQKAVKLLFPW